MRYLNQGIPPVGYWGVVLSEEIDAQGQPNRTESFLVNASTGDGRRSNDAVCVLHIAAPQTQAGSDMETG